MRWRPWVWLAALSVTTILALTLPYHETVVTNNGNGSGDTTSVVAFFWGEAGEPDFASSGSWFGDGYDGAPGAAQMQVGSVLMVVGLVVSLAMAVVAAVRPMILLDRVLTVSSAVLTVIGAVVLLQGMGHLEAWHVQDYDAFIGADVEGAWVWGRFLPFVAVAVAVGRIVADALMASRQGTVVADA